MNCVRLSMLRRVADADHVMEGKTSHPSMFDLQFPFQILQIRRILFPSNIGSSYERRLQLWAGRDR